MSAATLDTGWIDAGVSHVMVTRLTRQAPERIATALLAAGTWLGCELDAPAPGQRRFAADMRLRVSDDRSLVTFRKAAVIDLGPPRWLHNGWEVDVSWRASTLAPLFPVFSGRIVARYGELVASGWYAPPFGTLGRIADRVLLHVAASGTARWLLATIDDAATRGVANDTARNACGIHTDGRGDLGS